MQFSYFGRILNPSICGYLLNCLLISKTSLVVVFAVILITKAQIKKGTIEPVNMLVKVYGFKIFISKTDEIIYKAINNAKNDKKDAPFM